QEPTPDAIIRADAMHAKTTMRQALGGALFATGIRRRLVPGSLTVLLYHAVTASRYDDGGQMNVSIARFEEHLGAISNSDVDVVDLVEAVARVRSGASAKPAVAITFDDGFVGVHDLAAAALARRGWPATVFIVTSWVGGAAMPLADARLG